MIAAFLTSKPLSMTNENIPAEKIRDTRESLHSLLGVSASLAGLSIGIVTLLKAGSRMENIASFADDMLVVSAALFLATTYLAFWGLRARRAKTVITLSRAADTLFLIALTGLVVVGFAMVYVVV